MSELKLRVDWDRTKAANADSFRFADGRLNERAMELAFERGNYTVVIVNAETSEVEYTCPAHSAFQILDDFSPLAGRSKVGK